ncbi:MAG: HAD hydrolase family protein [Roseburia sp.]
MNHKILFVDLDATLLSDDKTVSEENRAAIQKMLLAGHDIVLSTGRPVESGRAVARELELTQPGCYMIAFNGAVLYDCAADRVLLKRSLPIEVTQELFERAAKAGIYAQTYNNTEIITTRHTAELEYYRKKTGLSYKLSANVLDLLEEEPQKVLMIDLKIRGVSRGSARRIWNGKRENVPAFSPAESIWNTVRLIPAREPVCPVLRRC